MNNIIGRVKEIEELHIYKESKESELVVVYGRRRVGKTFLIRKAFNNQFAFYHTGLSPIDIVKSNMLKAQLHHFNNSLKFQWNGYDGDDPVSWSDAFVLLRKYLLTLSSDEKQVVFIDELPWMATQRSGFLSAFEAFWNGWASAQDNICLIVCGSATSWIVDNILSNYGGLYNRAGHSIYLKPFTLQECEEYENARGSMRSQDEILRGYMIFGGIPHYWKQLDSSLSIVQNIDNLCFTKNGIMRLEFNALYASVFSNYKQYIKVIEALSSKRGGMKRSEILNALKMGSGGKISKILKDLENSGFIRSYRPIGSSETAYMLVDFYTLFYYKFISEENNADASFWSHSQNTPQINTWQGLTFEIVCIEHILQIKQALQIAGILCNTRLYRSQTAQVDLLIERADRTVNLCEMKYYQEPYEITASDDSKIRNRISELRPYYKKNTSFKVTFITPYGIKKGKHSDLSGNQVVIEDLFR